MHFHHLYVLISFSIIVIVELLFKANKKYKLDLCQLPRLTFRDHKMNTPHTSHGILEINYKSLPCVIWITTNKPRNNPVYHHDWVFPSFVVSFKIKCLHASWLSIAIFDPDLMLQFCWPCNLQLSSVILIKRSSAALHTEWVVLHIFHKPFYSRTKNSVWFYFIRAEPTNSALESVPKLVILYLQLH